MIRNIIKTLLRVIIRNKTFSFINILGLSFGMASTILILLYVYDEYQYDKFHENVENIYYVPSKHLYGTETWYGGGVPPMVAPTLQEEYPEVKYAVRINEGGEDGRSLSYNDINLFVPVSMADKELFKIFTIDFVKGNKETVFTDMYEIVLSESTAQQYFKNEDPIGKIMQLENQYEFKVTGVYKDLPEESTFEFKAIVPMEFRGVVSGTDMKAWYNCSFPTYVLLEENADYKVFSSKVETIVKDHKDGDTTVDIFLFPFGKNHLHSITGSGGRIKTVRTFLIIALLILIIACINFMNLSTARASMRSKEVGIRKVVGANKSKLIMQFFGEAVFLAFISHILAMIIVELVLPGFSNLANKEIEFHYGNAFFISVLFLIVIFTGLLAGSYPALFLSSFNPITVLKGTLNQGTKGAIFRKSLVILQFTVSVVLIISTIVILKQFNYFLNKDLGFKKDRLVYIELQGTMIERVDAFMNEFSTDPNIESMSLSSHIPTGIWWNRSGWEWDGKPENVDPLVTFLYPDNQFLETFDIKLKEGRFFSDEFRADSNNIVINNNLAQLIDSVSVLGKSIKNDGERYNIIGVVDDFHYKRLDRKLGPLMMFHNHENYRYLFLKLNKGNYIKTVDQIESSYNKHYSDFPFRLHFLDQELNDMYAGVNKRAKIFGYFAFFAILISCLGLFGLAQFIVERKTKEIGIKKTFGASYTVVLLSLMKDFGVWVLVSNILAWPIAYYFMKGWLENYPYQIELTISIFLIGTFVSFSIAILTVLYNTLKSAGQSPIYALRYE
jgi:putative ABC transport system permease protein